MTTRLRWPRVALAATSASVTLVAALGGAGVIGSTDAVAAERPAIVLEAAPAVGKPVDLAPAAPRTSSPGARPGVRSAPSPSARPSAKPSAKPSAVGSGAETAAALPPGSGSGRRVVFSESDQRVWLVGERGPVRASYLVSGSVYDNLEHGTYEVYSRSKQAWGIDDSGTMHYFVRFTRGDNAAIGFHDIPVSEGRRVQSVADLGTPTSHGCIRQRRDDARELWAFAPLGTTVVVTA